MLAGMSSRALAEWMAYYSIEPFVEELIDAHFAKLDAIMTSTKDNKTDPQDFRIWHRENKKEEFDPQSFFNGLKEVAIRAQEK
mgnify:CR=1 FL=1